MKVGITGATGQLGRLAIQSLMLRAPNTDLVAIARDPKKANDLGVKVRQADYRDRASFDAALQGIDVLVLISSSEFEDRVGQHRTVIDAAKAGQFCVEINNLAAHGKCRLANGCPWRQSFPQELVIG